jgi:hypothetical protein
MTDQQILSGLAADYAPYDRYEAFTERYAAYDLGRLADCPYGACSSKPGIAAPSAPCGSRAPPPAVNGRGTSLREE